MSLRAHHRRIEVQATLADPAAHVSDEVVESLSSADIDTHLEKPIELFGRSTFDLYGHMSFAVSVVKHDPARSAKHLESEPFRRSYLAIGSGEGRFRMALGDEFEGAARP